MVLKNLSLINFKQFDTIEFALDNKVNAFVGSNGIGKTNILDAIYQLSVGKSYFNPVTTQNIKHGENFFVIDGKFVRCEKDEHIVVSFKKGAKKVIKRNDKIYAKLSEFIGFIPLVIISPSDRDIINEGSDIRRKFVDTVISLFDKVYLNTLINYENILSQRNALLKYFAANQTFDKKTLLVYNIQMTGLAEQIHKKRSVFVDEFSEIFEEKYNLIAGTGEIPNIIYQSDLQKEGMQTLLEKHIGKDRMLQYTSVGIHKDDFIFNLEGYPIKKFGSQGQQKTFVTALKLAQFEFIKKQSNILPILLLDDIFDKLDENRVEKIVALVASDSFGQLFITDTHSKRTERIIESNFKSYKIFNI